MIISQIPPLIRGQIYDIIYTLQILIRINWIFGLTGFVLTNVDLIWMICLLIRDYEIDRIFTACSIIIILRGQLIFGFQ